MGGNTGVKQFIAYLALQEVSNMTKLRYYFDARKGATEAYAKSAFKQMMYNGTALTNNGTAVFNAIWANVGTSGNNGLRQSLWKPTEYPNITESQAKSVFINWVSTLDDKIFNFINVK